MSTHRRNFLRAIAPAAALPLVPASALARPDLVRRQEIEEALAFCDGQRLSAEALNRRFLLLLDLIFEIDPDKLRMAVERIERLNDADDYLDLETGAPTSRAQAMRLLVR